jgi:hypothetical protein
MLLGACGTASQDASSLVIRAENDAARRAKRAPACPTPTSNQKIESIAAYLKKAEATDSGLNTLATEWERLDEGARVCRTGRVSPNPQ